MSINKAKYVNKYVKVQSKQAQIKVESHLFDTFHDLFILYINN